LQSGGFAGSGVGFERKPGIIFRSKAKVPYREKPQSVPPLLLANPAKNNYAPPCSQVSYKNG